MSEVRPLKQLSTEKFFNFRTLTHLTLFFFLSLLAFAIVFGVSGLHSDWARIAAAVSGMLFRTFLGWWMIEKSVTVERERKGYAFHTAMAILSTTLMLLGYIFFALDMMAAAPVMIAAGLTTRLSVFYWLHEGESKKLWWVILITGAIALTFGIVDGFTHPANWVFWLSVIFGAVSYGFEIFTMYEMSGHHKH